jgi:inorganic phosphate transporter, PiT family
MDGLMDGLMDGTWPLLILLLISGAYLAWNIGANDVANAMGTSVGSGALTLTQAVVLAAILEFSGAFFFGSHVSETIQNGIIDASIFKDPLLFVFGMLSALISAGAWLQIASYFGLPVSTTHSIVGALVGFGVAVGGVEAIYWEHVLYIGTSWLLSPLLGALISCGLFSFLRRKIFYAHDPVAATKKLTPPLVFLVFFILGFIALYNGVTHVNFHPNFMESLGLSALAGLIGSAISKICIRRIAPAPHAPSTEAACHPEVLTQLEKARRHLLQASQASRIAGGAIAGVPLDYQVSDIMDQLQNLSDSLKKREESQQRNAEYATVEKVFGYLQIITACCMAFAHGANDVANAIGPLSAAIEVLTKGMMLPHAVVPAWALGLGGVGIVVGLATWGWRVIETIGKKITELTPTRGFSAEFGAAVTILVASRMGMPISTTHTLVGAVIGVGLARGIEALDLRTTRYIVISWVVTVPAGALLAIGLYYPIKALFLG